MAITDKQKRIGEASEIISAMGHENEKEGIKWTKHFMDQHIEKEWEDDQKIFERLGKSRNTRMEYHRVLHEILKTEVSTLDRPNYGYWFEAGYTKEGVWLKLHDRFKKVYTKAFKPTGNPKIDYYNGVNVLWGWIENKMMELEDPSTPLKSGVYVA